MAGVQKALTKEDLIYILQSVYKIAELEDNALQKTPDGLYVKSSDGEFAAHEMDTDKHINASIARIVNKLTVDSSDTLLYNGKPVSYTLSPETDNALQQTEQGLYVKDYHADTHINNSSIHVTQEKKNEWDAMLGQAKEFCQTELQKTFIPKMEIVTQLPTEDISSETLYFLLIQEDENHWGFVTYIYALDQWFQPAIGDDRLAIMLQRYVHEHANRELLDGLTEEDGHLKYKGNDLMYMGVLEDDTNAAKSVNGLLYVKDFTKELASLEISAAWAKVNLYNTEISDSGKYRLKDYIDRYNLLLIEYYYKPDKEGEPNGCAKTAVIDVDVINMLYDNHMDYMLEYGYGMMTSNSKIRMHGDYIWVDYYHNVCIYRITGIRKREE